MTRCVCWTRLASAVIVVSGAIVASGATATAQTSSEKGWIEGVLLSDKGQPVSLNGVYPTEITLRAGNGKQSKTFNETDKGGFYTFRDLDPGVYEVFVAASVAQVDGKRLAHRPQHLFGLTAGAGKRTMLNLTVHPGDQIEEIGKPTAVTEPAVNITEELARLRNEVGELKKQLDTMVSAAKPPKPVAGRKPGAK